jgi:hypothetical protein
MLDLRAYQNKLFSRLHDGFKGTNVTIVDEILEDTKLPVVHIGEYNLIPDVTKYSEWIIIQTLRVWSDSLGKEEINEITTKTSNLIEDLKEIKIDNTFEFEDVTIEEINVRIAEDGYVSVIKFKINIIKPFKMMRW